MALLTAALLGSAGRVLAHADMTLEHEGTAYCVAYSPNGKIIATGSADAVIRLWDAETGKPIGTIGALPGPAGRTRCTCSIAFTPDSRTLVAAFQWCTAKVDRWDGVNDVAGAVQIWDVESKKLRFSIDARLAPLMALAPDGKSLAVGRRDLDAPEIGLWDVETGKSAGVLPDRKAKPLVMTFSPDSKRLAVGTQDGAVELWNPAAKKLLISFQANGGDGAVGDLAFAPDGKTLAVDVESLKLFEVEDLGDIVMRDACSEWPNHTGRGGGLYYSPDGKALATGRYGTVELLSPWSGRFLDYGAYHWGRVTNFAFSPDGKRIAAAGGDETVTVWNIGEH
jgi:WD40 repeat protein